MNKNRNLGGKYYGAMRTSLYIMAGITLVAINSCDKISNPIIAKQTYSSLPTTAPDHITSTATDNTHKVLLEDYMGHFCVNCPAAVNTAESIISSSPAGTVVAMEVNVGFFADTAHTAGGPSVPGGLPDTAYANNYMTVAGTAWDNALVESSIEGVPQGLIDRIYFDASLDEDIGPANWPTLVDSLLGTPQSAAINMVDSCWIKQQIFGTQVTVKLLNAPTAGYSYYLQMVVVEDSVEDWQSDGTTTVQYYIHHNVLRSAINGSWGDNIGFTAANQPVTKNYTFTSSNFRYNAGTIANPPQVPARLWNMAHCYVIAFLYQRTNGGSGDYYVLQAQMLHI